MSFEICTNTLYNLPPRFKLSLTTSALLNYLISLCRKTAFVFSKDGKIRGFQTCLSLINTLQLMGFHKNTSKLMDARLKRCKKSWIAWKSCAAISGANPSHRRKAVGSTCRAVGRPPTGTSRRRWRPLQNNAQARRAEFQARRAAVECKFVNFSLGFLACSMLRRHGFWF